MNKMTDLFCRVSRSYNDLKTVFDHLKSKVSHLIVYEHLEDDEISRTHVHFYIEKCNITVEGIKKSIKLIFPDISRYDWSFNTKNVDRNCITYMSKGTLDPVFVFSDIDTDYYKGLWEDKKKSKTYQSRLQFVTKETPSEAKKRQNDLIEEMIANIGDTNDLSDDNVIKCIVKVLNDNKIIFGRYKVRDYFDTIQSRSSPEKFVVQMKNFCQYRV